MITCKKGFGLTLDAIMALMFIVLIMLAISAQRFTDLSDTTSTAFINLHYVSEDVLDVLNKQEVLDNVSEEWTSGNRTLATEIATTNLDLLIPRNMGYRLTFDGTMVAENLRVSEDYALAKTNSMRLLAGFTENKTSVGAVSRAYLTGIREKTSSVYKYFGGFVGQGELTSSIDVPMGVTITGAYMEMDSGAEFNLYINGQACQNPHTPTGEYLLADIKEDISSCGFLTGTNSINIQFTTPTLEDQFIGGGFIRVTYNTSLSNETLNTGVSRYNFPGIDGVINYYSSFFVPGEINSMDVHLEFDNNYTTFLKIGDTLVFNSSGQVPTQTVDLSNSYLLNKLDYNAISGETIPLRLGTSNVSDVIEEGNADVILITDLSGSMQWRVGYSDSTAGVVRPCCPVPITSQGAIADIGASAYGLSSGDYDNDGDIDVIAGDEAGQIELILNDGTGSFISDGIIDDVGSYAAGLASADFDLDNDIDFVCGDEAGQIELFLNDGTGSFTSDGIIYDVGTWAAGLVAADFDSDGDDDIISGDEYDQIELILNDGDGTFTYDGIIRDDNDNWAMGLASGDFDSDNNLDFLTGDRNGEVDLYMGDGLGSFTYDGNVETIVDRAYGLAAEDFDSDGDIDFIRGQTSGELTLYLNDGSAQFTNEGMIYNVNQRINDIIAADFDNDNDTDFIVAEDNGELEYFELDGAWPKWPECMKNDTGNPIYDSDTSRVSLAKCLDRKFAEIILNGTGNRVGLVGFNDDAYVYEGLSSDEDAIIEAIDDYPNSPLGGTCVCCAINRAYNMLNTAESATKNKFIIVMSDGITAYCCGTTGWWWWASCNPQGTYTSGQFEDCSGTSGDCSGGQCDGAINNAIWSAERSYDDLDITVNSVGFGPVSDCSNANYTLQNIADAGNGTYCASDDPIDLEKCYVRFATDILSASRKSQVLNISGGSTVSELYSSSYILFNYTPTNPGLDYGELILGYDTDRFNDNVTCEGNFFIPSTATALEVRTTSYSSEHWTHYSSISNSQGVRSTFRLADYGNEYYTLGDPYTVNIPPNYITSGENNTVYTITGDTSTNATGCSLDNRAIIKLRMAGSVGYGNVYPTSNGCNWHIEFEDGSLMNIASPMTYNGTSQCSYAPGNLSRVSDSMADAMYRLLTALDIDLDGAVDIKFDANQIEFDLSGVGGIKSLWGPAKMRLIVWF